MNAGIVQRLEFAPALFTRELAAYYLSMSIREVDDLRASGELIPVGKETSKRIKFTREELDRYVKTLPERVA